MEMLLLVSGGRVVAPASSSANMQPGNAQGNIILFEPSTSEHLSARTIFDPITALAPASDCRTFAIGCVEDHVVLPSDLSLTRTQIPQWLDIDCDAPAILHHSSHSHHPQSAFTHRRLGLAWLFIETEIGDAGSSDIRW